MPTIKGNADVELEYEVYCAKCGTWLSTSVTDRPKGGGNYETAVEIAPCEACLSNARGDGYDEGFRAATKAEQGGDE